MGILRLILAVNVLLLHVDAPTLLRFLHTAEAVQTFFILSGFYMALTLAENYQHGEIRHFYLNRFLRIFPVYWLILAASFTIAGLGYYFLNRPGFLFYWMQTKPAGAVLPFVLAVFSSLAILGQGTAMLLRVDAAGGLKIASRNPWHSPDSFVGYFPMPQAWSLEFELLFYLLAPFMVRFRTRTILGICLLSLLLRIWLTISLGLIERPWALEVFPTELLFFGSGILSYRLYVYGRDNKWFERRQLSDTVSVSLLVATLAYGAFGLLTKGAYLSVYKWTYLLFTTIAVPFLFTTTRKSKVDRFMGELSYPLYLVHVLIIGLWPKAEALNPWIRLPGIIVTSLVVSYLLLKVTAQIENLRSRHRHQ